MVSPSQYRWIALVCAAVPMTVAACSSPTPPPAEHAQSGIRVVGVQQSRAGLSVGQTRGARIDNEFVKVDPARTIQLEELLQPGDRPISNNGLCPSDMASIDDRY